MSEPELVPKGNESAARASGSRHLLAVFAHPDDEALCAGGTLALCRSLGQRVTLVCATRGELGPVSDQELVANTTLAEVRERELRECCAQLGIEDVRILGLPDAGVQWAAARAPEVLGGIVQLIRSLRPDVIVTFGPDGLYGHFDHVAIGELVVEARAAAADSERFAEQLGPECVPYATPRLFFPVMTGEQVARAVDSMAGMGLPHDLWSLSPSDFVATLEQVTTRVDVSAVLPAKLRALRSHRTQLAQGHLLRHVTPEVAATFLGVECFRCADGRGGDPLHG